MGREIKIDGATLYEMGADLNSDVNNGYLQKLENIWNQNMTYNIRTQIQYDLLCHILGFKNDNIHLYGVYYSIDGAINPSPLLIGALKNLINMADYSLSNINDVKMKLKEEYDEIVKGLKKEKKGLEETCNSYKKSNNEIAWRNQQLNNKLNELEGELKELRSENKNLVNINTIFRDEIGKLESVRPTPSLPASASVNKEVIVLSERCAKQQTEIDDLKSKNQEYINALKEYKHLEKELLPTMIDTIYCTRKKGKSISLEVSQIENIFSEMLKGERKLSISNKYHIARSTITKVWNIDYATSNSLKKISYALHTVNGNWGLDKKKILTEKISLCEEKLKMAEYIEKNDKAGIKEQILGLSDFVEILNEPKQEKYDKKKRSKNGSRYVIEDEQDMNVEDIFYSFDNDETVVV